jgi:rubrerythrin
MKAWNGTVARGFPQEAMSFFASARTPEEFVTLAWLLEEGTRKLYEGLAGSLGSEEVSGLFRQLASAEERHKDLLKILYERRSAKQTGGPDFSTLIASQKPEEEFTEGGVPVQEALLWVKGKPTAEILELVMSLEVNAYDRYLTMEREVKDQPSEEVFKVLSRAEKGHIQEVSAVFENML